MKHHHRHNDTPEILLGLAVVVIVVLVFGPMAIWAVTKWFPYWLGAL